MFSVEPKGTLYTMIVSERKLESRRKIEPTFYQNTLSFSKDKN